MVAGAKLDRLEGRLQLLHRPCAGTGILHDDRLHQPSRFPEPTGSGQHHRPRHTAPAIGRCDRGDSVEERELPGRRPRERKRAVELDQRLGVPGRLPRFCFVGRLRLLTSPQPRQGPRTPEAPKRWRSRRKPCQTFVEAIERGLPLARLHGHLREARKTGRPVGMTSLEIAVGRFGLRQPPLPEEGTGVGVEGAPCRRRIPAAAGGSPVMRHGHASFATGQQRNPPGIRASPVRAVGGSIRSAPSTGP